MHIVYILSDELCFAVMPPLITAVMEMYRRTWPRSLPLGTLVVYFSTLICKKKSSNRYDISQWILYTQAQILDGSANNHTGTSTFGENSISRVVFVALCRNMAVLSAHRAGCQKYYVAVQFHRRYSRYIKKIITKYMKKRKKRRDSVVASNQMPHGH